MNPIIQEESNLLRYYAMSLGRRANDSVAQDKKKDPSGDAAGSAPLEERRVVLWEQPNIDFPILMPPAIHPLAPPLVQERQVILLPPQPSIQNWPQEVHSKVVGYLTDELHKLPCISKAFGGLVEAYRKKFWKAISSVDSKIALLQQAKELNKPDQTIKQRLNGLARLLRIDPRNEDVSTFIEAARNTTYAQIYYDAVRANDQNLVFLCRKSGRLVNPHTAAEGFVRAAVNGPLELLQFLYVPLGARDLQGAKGEIFYDFQTNQDTLKNAFSAAVRRGDIKMANFLIQLGRKFNGDNALTDAMEMNSVDMVKLVLKAQPQLTLSTACNPSAGLNEGNASPSDGLQNAIFTAFRSSAVEAFDALLLYSQPSKEILEYALDWLLYHVVYSEACARFPDPPTIELHPYRSPHDPERERLRQAVPERFRRPMEGRNSGKFTLPNTCTFYLNLQPAALQALIKRLREEIRHRFSGQEVKEREVKEQKLPMDEKEMRVQGRSSSPQIHHSNRSSIEPQDLPFVDETIEPPEVFDLEELNPGNNNEDRRLKAVIIAAVFALFLTHIVQYGFRSSE
ncbi:MAG: hypothetical protein WCF19_02860 [Chlamydiales bacterium]